MIGKQHTLWKKQQWLWIALWTAIFMFMIILIPGILVKHSPSSLMTDFDEDNTRLETEKLQQPPLIPVFLSREEQIINVPLEQYVRGVLAAEMPIEFELEAMKAQAMAARTYIVRRLLDQDDTHVPVKGALVTDTVMHQAYVTEEQLRKNWGTQYDVNLEKVTKAVQDTKGFILTYEGKPINATFFSTSNGYTENSEEYWQEHIPYLRSVPSPWDIAISPKYKSTTTLDARGVFRSLGLSHAVAAVSSGRSSMKVMEETEGHRIKKIQIGGKLFSGREMREKLGLPSSHFTWKWVGNQIEFTTLGYGHGVGMSQWGANGMAKEGQTAEQIVKHYYSGIDIQKITE